MRPTLSMQAIQALAAAENERFVQNAPPQVVALEHKKQADAAAKCRLLEERLAQLS